MMRLRELQLCSNIHDIASLLGYKTSRLAYILYKMTDSYKYHEFEVKKKAGGARKICAPCDKLKTLQKRLSDLLQDCIENINSVRGIKTSMSHGFKRNYSIATNASNHISKRYVMNLDLENFFGEFNFGRVRGFFIKNKNFKLTDKVATIIAQIACFNNSLPQGSPASPVITNLIAHTLDIRLSGLAKKYSCRYSRYADDITFSTNLKCFPVELAIHINEKHSWVVGDVLESQINKLGFTINHKKTRVQYSGSRQEVTGVVVNKKPNVKSEYWRSVRAMTHTLFNTGTFTHKKAVIEEDGKISIEEKEGTIAQLGGMLSFIDMLDKYNKRHEKKPSQRRELNSRERTYKKFLFFKHFFHVEKPIVMCEGKTDYIYLLGAIKSLSDKFPALFSKDKDGKKEAEIGFYRYGEVTDRMFGLAGGADNLTKFISGYSEQCETYKVPITDSPILIVTDNDSGVRNVFAAAKNQIDREVKGDKPFVNKQIDREVKGDKPFYHIRRNLYLLPIPKKDNKDTAIEDFFNEELLKTKVSGKSFHYLSATKEIDTETEYSKTVFAKQVVARNRDTIDFSGFEEILNNIESAINDYKKKCTQNRQDLCSDSGP